MEFVAIVTVLIVLQVFWFSIAVGKARMEFGVKAPAVTGDPGFERAYRVHQNTIEQVALVLPVMWVFAWYVHALTAAGLGLLFIVGRFVYSSSYRRDPATRSAGFGIGAVAFAILALGSLGGIVWGMIG